MKKHSERRKHSTRTGCSKVRTPPARPLSQTHRQDRLQYTALHLATVQCNNNKNLCGRDGHTIDRRTDRQTDRRTDRVRRNMRPPPREEGRIIKKCPLGFFYNLRQIEPISENHSFKMCSYFPHLSFFAALP